MACTIRATRPVLSCALNLAPPGELFEALARAASPHASRGVRSQAKRKGPCEPLSKDSISDEPANHRTSISTVTNETVIMVSRAMYLAAVLM